jgi:AbrB family looped-hinge helix DNA binding protein
MTTTITSKGQITIPARLRQKLQLRAGHVLEFDENAPFLKAYRRIDPEEARSVIGCAKKVMKGMTAEEWLSQTRGRRVRLRK